MEWGLGWARRGSARQESPEGGLEAQAGGEGGDTKPLVRQHLSHCGHGTKLA